MIQEKIEKYLESNPVFRERRNKNRMIAGILKSQFGLQDSLNTVEAVAVEASSLDRAWRKALQDRPELRGDDYQSKQSLENKSRIELGYGAGFSRRIEKPTLFK